MMRINRKIKAFLSVALVLVACTACGREAEESSKPTFDNAYSEALSAYKDLLLNKTPAPFSYGRIYNPSPPSKFTIIDMNDDGIPELLLNGGSSIGFIILTYEDGSIKKWYSAQAYITFLNNKAIFSEFWRREEFTYYEFDPYDKYILRFYMYKEPWPAEKGVDEFYCWDFSTGSPGQRTDNRVSEEEFNELLASYKEFAKNNADMIPWVDYDEWRAAHGDEYIPIRTTEMLDSRILK
jgi:hypothetical protein